MECCGISFPSAPFGQLKAAQVKVVTPFGCRKVISQGSEEVIALEGRKVCALTHIHGRAWSGIFFVASHELLREAYGFK
jgi:hypothetical protein